VGRCGLAGGSRGEGLESRAESGRLECEGGVEVLFVVGASAACDMVTAVSILK